MTNYFRMVSLILLGFTVAALAQGPGRGQFRRHTATKAQSVRLVPASESTRWRNEVQVVLRGSSRQIESNGIPDHQVGAFPNRDNPNEIAPQRYQHELPADPKPQAQPSQLRGSIGVAVNGVPFDPGAAEFWMGDPGFGWNYEALGGAVPLGLDENHAHVQPTGAYHYHGLPTLLLSDLGVKASAHSPIVGWAADGFPIYALYGYSDPKDSNSSIAEVKSSYQLKSGQRPGGQEPDGDYDGAFVQDYDYVAGKGDLDECNGRFVVTPEFPDGTYAYFLTNDWPVIPRLLRGEPVQLRGPGLPPGGLGGPGGPGGPGGRPPRGNGPPPPRPF